MGKAMVWVINTSKEHSFNPRFRYIVIEFEESYYLIDNDQAWWGYISPIFTWKIPETVMKINLPEEEVDALLLDKEGVKKAEKTIDSMKGVAIFISLVLGPAFLFSMLEDFFNFYLPIFINVLIAFTTIIGMLVLKSRASKSAIQVIDIIGKENLSVMRMLIFPASVGKKISILIGRMIFLILPWLLFMFLFTEENRMNLIMWFSGVFGLLMILYPNNFHRMLVKHSVKIVDQ